MGSALGGAAVPLLWALLPEESQAKDWQAWWAGLSADLRGRCGPAAPAGGRCDALDRWNYAVLLSDLGETQEAVRELRRIAKSDGREEPGFRFMLRKRLAEELLDTGKAKEAHKVLTKAMAGEKDASQRFTLQVPLVAAELALNRSRPSPERRRVDSEHRALSRAFVSRYVGWGSREGENAVVSLPSAPGPRDFAKFLERRQPFSVAAPAGATVEEAAAAGLRALGLPDAWRALRPERLLRKAGSELVFAMATRARGHPSAESAERAVFAYENEHLRRFLCNFSAVLADVYGKIGKAKSGEEEGCLAQRLGAAGREDWRTYLSIQANLLPPPDGENSPYGRPLYRLKRALPKPAAFGDLGLSQVHLWLGKGPTRSALHHDWQDTLYVLVEGRKRFRLFPPSEAAAALPVHPARSVSPGGATEYASSVDHEHLLSSGEFSQLIRSDLSAAASPFPEEAEALRRKGLEVELRAGQALFLPGFWLHEVESSGADGDRQGPHLAVSFQVTPSDLEKRVLRARSAEL